MIFAGEIQFPGRESQGECRALLEGWEGWKRGGKSLRRALRTIHSSTSKYLSSFYYMPGTVLIYEVLEVQAEQTGPVLALFELLKTGQLAPIGIVYAEPHVTKLRLNYSSGF